MDGTVSEGRARRKVRKQVYGWQESSIEAYGMTHQNTWMCGVQFLMPSCHLPKCHLLFLIEKYEAI